MGEIFSAIVERVQDFLFLLGDFFTYLFEQVMTDRKARYRFLGLLAALLVLIIGVMVFSRTRGSRNQSQDIYPSEEVTSAPVVEEAVITPAPAAGSGQDGQGTQEAPLTDAETSAPAEGTASGVVQATPAAGAQTSGAGAARVVADEAVTTSGGIRQINEYVVKNGSSASVSSAADSGSASPEDASSEDASSDGEGEDEDSSGEDYYEEDYSGEYDEEEYY